MRINRSKGFTLIELLIVIAIIGILAAVLIPQLMRARSVAVDRAAEGYMQNVYTAGNAYMAEWVTAGPADVLDLTTDCTDGATFGEYGTQPPSFDVDASGCTVSDQGDDIGVTLTYNGGVNGTETITLNVP